MSKPDDLRMDIHRDEGDTCARPRVRALCRAMLFTVLLAGSLLFVKGNLRPNQQKKNLYGETQLVQLDSIFGQASKAKNRLGHRSNEDASHSKKRQMKVRIYNSHDQSMIDKRRELRGRRRMGRMGRGRSRGRGGSDSLGDSNSRAERGRLPARTRTNLFRNGVFLTPPELPQFAPIASANKNLRLTPVMTNVQIFQNGGFLPPGNLYHLGPGYRGRGRGKRGKSRSRGNRFPPFPDFTRFPDFNTRFPTLQPSQSPSIGVTSPAAPSISLAPSLAPSISLAPSSAPSSVPSSDSTLAPTSSTLAPTSSTIAPTTSSSAPSMFPSVVPSGVPSQVPSNVPSSLPTIAPSAIL